MWSLILQEDSKERSIECVPKYVMVEWCPHSPDEGRETHTKKQRERGNAEPSS